jgi:hypothetical protein
MFDEEFMIMMGQIFNAMWSKNSSTKARHVAMVAQGAWEVEMAKQCCLQHGFCYGTLQRSGQKKFLRSIVCSRYILCCWEVSTNPSTYVQLVINCREKNQVELTFLGYIVPKGKGQY